MRIFLTGGTGFIGSHFLKMALQAGHEVVALRHSSKTCKLSLPSQPTWISSRMDEITPDILIGCNAFVHFAARGVNPKDASWDECFKWNVDLSLKLWINAANAGVRRFVIAGSCFEYGSIGEQYDFIPPDAPLFPTGPYHSSKAAATMAALGLSVDKDLEMLILRPFHVYGNGEAPDRFWPTLVKAAANGEDLHMTEGTQVRDFTPVEHVASKFLLGIERGDLIPGCPIIENLGSGKPKTLIQFAKEEWRRLDAKGKIRQGVLSMRNNEVKRYVPQLLPDL